jgi:hypothetical protein
MVNDIIFYSNYFFMDLPTYSSGVIKLIEAQTEYFEIKIPQPERISVL